LELAERNAVGLIEEAYLFGCPVLATKKEWIAIASVVSGRVVNGYLNNDWLLSFLYRASAAFYSDVAGLTPVKDVAGVENVCLDDVITGHMEYRAGMPKILKRCGFQVDQEFFEDEDDEEEKERAAKEAERLRLKEEKVRQKQEEYEEKERKRKEAAAAKSAEAERKRLEKEAELERRRLKKEAELEAQSQERELAEKFELDFKRKFEAQQQERRKSVGADDVTGVPSARSTTAESKRSSFFGFGSWFSRPPSSESITEPSREETFEKEKIDLMLTEYWEPKEIQATLPPLVISSEDIEKKSATSKTHPTISPLPKAFVSSEDDGFGDIGQGKHSHTGTTFNDFTADTRYRDGLPAVFHPSGYQGPLSTASSSSDIGTGAGLIVTMGGLPVIKEGRPNQIDPVDSRTNLLDDSLLFEHTED
jgi:hypothetical protein